MANFPCPCCGYLVFAEPPGSYDVCPVCFWEDCVAQLEFATTCDGGPNRITLAEAQRNFAELGACAPGFVSNVRPPRDDEPRDPGWRPLDSALDRFDDFADPESSRAPAADDTLYYWRPTFWRRKP